VLPSQEAPVVGLHARARPSAAPATPVWSQQRTAITISRSIQSSQRLIVDGPNQLWVADITYVAIVEGFAYVAVILDAWSRRAVGYGNQSAPSTSA